MCGVHTDPGCELRGFSLAVQRLEEESASLMAGRVDRTTIVNFGPTTEYPWHDVVVLNKLSCAIDFPPADATNIHGLRS